jgi:spore cortex biosynthesis protein YabQ
MQETPVILQGYYFLLTMAMGAGAGGLFDFYRTCRYFRRPRRRVGVFLDVLFFLVLTALVFAGLLRANWADVRFYVFVGLALGLALYYLFLSSPVLRLFRFFLGLLLRILGFFLQGLRACLGFLLALLALPARPLLFLGRFLRPGFSRGRARALKLGGKAVEKAKKMANIFPGRKS